MPSNQLASLRSIFLDIRPPQLAAARADQQPFAARVLKLSIRCRKSPGVLIESRWKIDWKNRLFRTKIDGLTDLEFVFGHCEARKRSPGNDTGAELMHATIPRSRMRIGWQQWLIMIRVCGWPGAGVRNAAVHPCTRPAPPRLPRGGDANCQRARWRSKGSFGARCKNEPQGRLRTWGSRVRRLIRLPQYAARKLVYGVHQPNL
jgi:hypothetical protein